MDSSLLPDPLAVVFIPLRLHLSVPLYLKHASAQNQHHSAHRFGLGLLLRCHALTEVFWRREVVDVEVASF
jgi:hypothetical protein